MTKNDAIKNITLLEEYKIYIQSNMKRTSIYLKGENIDKYVSADKERLKLIDSLIFSLKTDNNITDDELKENL